MYMQFNSQKKTLAMSMKYRQIDQEFYYKYNNNEPIN